MEAWPVLSWLVHVSSSSFDVFIVNLVQELQLYAVGSTFPKKDKPVNLT